MNFQLRAEVEPAQVQAEGEEEEEEEEENDKVKAEVVVEVAPATQVEESHVLRVAEAGPRPNFRAAMNGACQI
jgi:hypothetical protein